MSHLIEEHARWLRYVGRSERTIGARRRLLLHADVHLPWGLDQADESELIEYATEADWSQWTRHTYDGHLRGYYQWAVLTGKLTLDPMLHIPKPGEGDRMPNPCSDDELAAALTAPDQPWRAAVMLAAYAGLRCGEIVTARREHISAGRLRVRGKGKRVRVVPLAPHLLAELEARGPGLLCVGSRRGQPLTPQMLTQMQRAVWRRIGLDDTFRLHRLRHWFATRLLDNGADIRVVQLLLGHASLHSTEGYTLVTNSRMADAVQALPVVEPEPDGSRLGPATAAEAA